MLRDGFTMDDVYPRLELFSALAEADYTIMGNGMVLQSLDVDMRVEGGEVTFDFSKTHEEAMSFERIKDFKNLVVAASMLSLLRASIDAELERRWPQENIQPIPAFSETVNMYIAGNSDSDGGMSEAVRAIRYAATVQSPHFLFFNNQVAHSNDVLGYEIAGIVYKEYIGRTFIYDENGNIYRELLADPGDLNLYYPQHLYAIKQMMAQIDTILAYDPEAVIVVQADHGIHAIGPGSSTVDFDSDFMFARGYSLEDQLNLNLQVMSAVRIPPQYGELAEPLDPLDISRYLVEHFIGGGNYEYLYYQEGGN
jgi:hypothetical protein